MLHMKNILEVRKTHLDRIPEKDWPLFFTVSSSELMKLYGLSNRTVVTFIRNKIMEMRPDLEKLWKNRKKNALDDIPEDDWKKVLFSPVKYAHQKYGIPLKSVSRVKNYILRERPEWSSDFDAYVDSKFYDIPYEEFESFVSLTQKEAREKYGMSNVTYSRIRKDIFKRRPDLENQENLHRLSKRRAFDVPESEYERFVTYTPEEKKQLGISPGSYHRRLQSILRERPELEAVYRRALKNRTKAFRVPVEEYEKFLSITPSEARKYYGVSSTVFFHEKKRILDKRPDLSASYSLSYDALRRYKISPSMYSDIVLSSPYKTEIIYGIPWRQHRRIRNRIFLDKPRLEAMYHDTKMRLGLGKGRESSEVSVPPEEYTRFIALSKSDAVELYGIHDSGYDEYKADIIRKLSR